MDDGKHWSRRLTARLRYRFDLALARGPMVVIAYLGLAMVVIIAIAATLDTLLRVSGISGQGRLGFGEEFWQSLLRVVDTGTFASDTHWTTRIISLCVTLSGIFIAGSLIGLIANAIDVKIDNLRKGRSAVLESGHTLVLGWSPRIATILSELVIANLNHRRQAFVVLADRPKDEMEDELRRLVPDTGTTRVVCRTGNIGAVTDLQLVNIDQARSVIVLAGEHGDAGVVTAVLAVRTLDPTFERIRVVAEMTDADHAATLRLVTDNRIATVRAEDVVSQVTAQACHQSGLAGVFRDLLDFDGDEIYFAEVPELTGHTYRAAVRAFNEACVIGLHRDGVPQLNPEPDETFRSGDMVIAIARDDDCVQFTGFVDELEVDIDDRHVAADPAQNVVIVGWSSLGSRVLAELDLFLGDGSSVDIVVDPAMIDAAAIELPACAHCRPRLRQVEPRSLLEALSGADYDQAIVLGYRNGLDAQQADARSMLTLLALHRLWAQTARRPRVVAEMLDSSNVAVAADTGADDFIVSDELSSLMIAQLSERLELRAVFEELFDSSGCFVSLHPAGRYAPAGPTTFGHVAAAAADRGVSAIGYRIANGAAVLNPAKTTTVELGPSDQVLVLGPRPARPASNREFPGGPVTVAGAQSADLLAAAPAEPAL